MRLFAVLLAASLSATAPKAWLGLGYLFYPASGRSAAWMRVIRIIPGGPADRAGLRQQDLITAIDNRPLPFGDDVAALRYFAALKPGARLRLHVRRGVADLDLTIVPQPAPAGADKLMQQNLDLATKKH